MPRLLTYFREEFQVEMHENTLRNRLKELKYVFRRPKHDLTSLQNADAKERAQEVLTEQKKAKAEEIELFFVDETTIGLLC